MMEAVKAIFLAILVAVVIALATAVAVAKQEKIGRVRATADGGENWFVHVDGQAVSRHSTERIASVEAINQKIRSPLSSVYYDHRYRDIKLDSIHPPEPVKSREIVPPVEVSKK